MKALILSIIIIATTLCGAQEPDKAQEEFIRLLKDISTTEALREHTKFLSRADAESDKKLVEYAREKLGKADRAIPEIRKLILKGKNVLDYPGLLACGRIKFDKYSGYELYFGVHFGGQGTYPYDFTVIFDSKGVITDVKDVLWKK